MGDFVFEVLFMQKSNFSIRNSRFKVILGIVVFFLFLAIAPAKETNPEDARSATFLYFNSQDSFGAKEEILFSGDHTFLAQSVPTYHKPQVMGAQLGAEKEKDDVQEKTEKTPEEERIVLEERWVEVTGYAPLDPAAQLGVCYSGNPAITASGTKGRDGIVAANFLSFGTKIRIPNIFGDKIFIVEDRMSPRFNNRVDVWLYSQREALNLGVQSTRIEILE